MGQRGYIAILGPVSWIYQRAASLLTNSRRRGGTVIRGELKHDRRLVWYRMLMESAKSAIVILETSVSAIRIFGCREAAAAAGVAGQGAIRTR